MALRRQRDLSVDPLVESKLDQTEVNVDPPVKSLRRKRTLGGPIGRQAKQAQVGHTGIGESQHDTNINMEALGHLNTIRADKQPWYDQAGNFVAQAVVGEIVGGTIEGLGYLTDVESMLNLAKGEEQEWGNWLSDIGKGIREGTEERTKIYQEAPGEFNPSDSGWWFGNGVSVASSLSLLIPSVGGAKALSFLGKGLSKGAGMLNKSLDIASKMGAKAKWMSAGVSQAVVSRHMENMMEASGTFNDKFNEYKAQGMDEELARATASEAASFNYNAGWAMLLQDIPQYLAIGKIFNPVTGKMESKLADWAKKSGKKPGFVKKFGPAAATFGSEGLEEGYQFTIAEEGKYLADYNAGLIDKKTFEQRMGGYVKEGEFWNSVAFGAMGGAVFQFGGTRVNDLMKGNKGRETSANMKKVNDEFVKNNGMQAAMSFSTIAEADGAENISQMKEARMASNISATMKAIELDNFELHLETLENLKNATPEEIEARNAEGNEISQDILNEVVPEMIQASLALREDYLKLRNKHNPKVASLIALNNNNIKKFESIKKRNDKVYQDGLKAIPGMEKVSTAGKSIIDSTVKIEGLKKVNAMISQRVKANKTDEEIGTKQIDENNKEIEKESKNISKQKEKKEGVPSEITAGDKKLIKRAKNSSELSDAVGAIHYSDQMIDHHYDQIDEVQTPEYSAKIELAQKKAMFESLNNIDDINEAIEKLEAPDNATFDDPKDRESTLGGLKARRDKLTAIAKREAIKAAQKQAEEEAANTPKDPKSVKNDKTNSTDNIEDSLNDYEFDSEDLASTPQDEATMVNGKNANHLRILDKSKTGTIGSEKYQTWLVNGNDKTGVSVEYTVGDPVSENATKALELFNKGSLSDFVYDWLPIKATFANDPEIFSFVTDAAQRARRVSENQLPYDKSEGIERRRIINEINENGSAETTIAKQLGGELVKELNEEGFAANANNTITDMYNQADNVADVDMYISNEFGSLISAEDKTSREDMDFTLQPLDIGTEGETIPYKGAIFMKVKRANGQSFPLKMNMTFSTLQESETLVEMMIQASIMKGFKYTSTMKSLQQSEEGSEANKMYKRIQSQHPAELRLIGMDGTISDFIQSFVYMNEDTKDLDLALYAAGQSIVFGEQGDRSNMNEANIPQERAKLSEYIQTRKRRQFKRMSWSKLNNPEWRKYRSYLVEGNIISTDVVADKSTPIFNSGADRPANLYAKSIESKKTGPDNSRTGRLKRTQEFGIRPKGDKFEGLYIAPNGSESFVTMAKKEHTEAFVNAKYKGEITDAEVKTPENAEISQGEIHDRIASIKKSIAGLEAMFKDSPSQAVSDQLTDSKEQLKELESKVEKTQKADLGVSSTGDLAVATIGIKYSPVNMDGYGKSYTQADISEGGKSIVFNSHKQPFKIKDGILTASIDDIDGKTFYPISVDLRNNPKYLDYQKKKDALDAERRKLINEGEKGIEDMLRGKGASASVAKKVMLDLLSKELGKNNRIASTKTGKLSNPEVSLTPKAQEHFDTLEQQQGYPNDVMIVAGMLDEFRGLKFNNSPGQKAEKAGVDAYIAKLEKHFESIKGPDIWEEREKRLALQKEQRKKSAMELKESVKNDPLQEDTSSVKTPETLKGDASEVAPSDKILNNQKFKGGEFSDIFC